MAKGNAVHSGHWSRVPIPQTYSHSLAFRDIIFNNWLLNPSGKPNSWVKVDIMQEHMNFWIKVEFFLKPPGFVSEIVIELL